MHARNKHFFLYSFFFKIEKNREGEENLTVQIVTCFTATPHRRRILPNNLGKVPRRLGKASRFLEIILFALQSPGVDGRRRVRVPGGEVLAGGAARVVEFALVGPVLRVGCAGGIPGQGRRVVFHAVEVVG